MTKLLLTLPLALGVAACASSGGPNYMAASDDGDYGYYESALDYNHYRVAYKIRGNAVEKAKDYALVRAAELTLQNGYEWFEVVDRNTDVKERETHDANARMRIRATTYRECGLLRCTTVNRPAYVDPDYYGRNDRSIPESTVTFIEVAMGKGEKPSGSNVYDARTLSATISTRS